MILFEGVGEDHVWDSILSNIRLLVKSFHLNLWPPSKSGVHLSHRNSTTHRVCCGLLCLCLISSSPTHFYLRSAALLIRLCLFLIYVSLLRSREGG